MSRIPERPAKNEAWKPPREDARLVREGSSRSSLVRELPSGTLCLAEATEKLGMHEGRGNGDATTVALYSHPPRRKCARRTVVVGRCCPPAERAVHNGMLMLMRSRVNLGDLDHGVPVSVIGLSLSLSRFISISLRGYVPAVLRLRTVFANDLAHSCGRPEIVAQRKKGDFGRAIPTETFCVTQVFPCPARWTKRVNLATTLSVNA